MNIERYEAEMAEAVSRAREAMEPRQRGEGASALCPAERSVLRLLGLGLSMAAALGISMNTVKTYMTRPHDKCAVEGRSRLAVAAYKVMEAGA